MLLQKACHAPEGTPLRRIGDENQPVRFRERQRAKQHSIQNCEYRGIGADAQRQGHDRDGGKSRIAAQSANRVTKIAQEVVHGWNRTVHASRHG